MNSGVLLMVGQGGQSGGGSIQFVLLGMIVLVFWLFMIRPQAKKQKQQKTFMQNLKKGDKIVTISGMHGTINKLNDDGTLMLEVSPGSYVKLERTAISMEMTAKINKVATAEPIK